MIPCVCVCLCALRFHDFIFFFISLFNSCCILFFFLCICVWMCLGVWNTPFAVKRSRMVDTIYKNFCVLRKNDKGKVVHTCRIIMECQVWWQKLWQDNKCWKNRERKRKRIQSLGSFIVWLSSFIQIVIETNFKSNAQTFMVMLSQNPEKGKKTTQRWLFPSSFLLLHVNI